jgi:hypothetical protein
MLVVVLGVLRHGRRRAAGLADLPHGRVELAPLGVGQFAPVDVARLADGLEEQIGRATRCRLILRFQDRGTGGESRRYVLRCRSAATSPRQRGVRGVYILLFSLLF